MTNKYSIGLDIGTNSVGWAVVDENNQLVKKNGRTLWGVRMFEEAIDASERRNHRNNRRLLNRRHHRIMLLRSIFADEINLVDPTFFERMDDSFYRQVDKRNNNFHNLFVSDYTDKDFFTEFPTIFHLRKYLMEETKKVDIRFIYLALHNMIKFRGNFLIPGDTFNKGDKQKIENVFNSLNELMVELSTRYEDFSDYFSRVEVNDKMLNKLQDILLSVNTKTEKKKLLKDLFKCESKSLLNEFIIPLLIGSKCNVNKLTFIKDNKYEKCEISLNVENLDDIISDYTILIPELEIIFEFLPQIKSVVDHYFLIKLLQNSESLSDAMIKKYNEHNDDLLRLKKFIKKYLPKKYNECFRKVDSKLCNYPKYVGMNSSNGEMERFSHCTREDFYSYLQSLFKQIEDSAASYDIQYFRSKIENADFLLRQNSDQNSSLPMQLNLYEITTILDKQKNNYPFLLEKDSSGLTNIQKIISIFKYKLPYYVGPLSQNSEYSWVKRSDEKIYPWNLEQVVDMDETAKRFIERMQRKCTYLKGEADYCLPKNSLIFSKYNCYSYLNKLSINGSLISVELKKELFDNVFLKIKKPTKKNILAYLTSNYGVDTLISTSKLKDLPEVNCDMSSYIKFKEIFGDSFADNIDLIEHIIKDIVIFEDKTILEKRLKNVYNLQPEVIKKIKDLNYKEYSNLSKKLLAEHVIINHMTGEVYGTVLDIMENTNCNLQEILYDEKYRLIDWIDEYNKENSDSFDSVDDFLQENVAVSPIMKRPLIQAYTIICEVEKILGQPIDNYYVECARTNNEKKVPKDSRYQNLIELYKSCKDIAIQFGIDMQELSTELEMCKDKLRSDLIYLYFTQLGRSAYSLKPIDFSDLINNYKYDIDHIYPQSLIKDDSLSNRVLVTKEENEKKKDNFLFEVDNLLHKDAFKFYDMLRERKLISKEKYERLTKRDLSIEELNNFVNRQLVATNQSVKGLIQVLKLYKNVNSSNIIYSKAENISLARKLFDWPKSRLANNYHHAHDAYLNVVVGRVINEYYKAFYFNNINDYYRLKVDNITVNPEKILKRNFVKVNGKVIWDKNLTIELINYNLYQRYDVNETIRTFNSNEMFKKVTILPKGSSERVPVKTTDPRVNVLNYGGITSNSFCKFVILKNINKKNEVEYILEAIPKVYENKVDKYLNLAGYSNYEIMHNNIKTNVVVQMGKTKFAITGRSNDSYVCKNLCDRNFNKHLIHVIKKLEKYYDNLSKKVFMPYTDESIIISPAKNNSCDMIDITKNELIDLFTDIKKKFNTEIFAYSIIKNIGLNMNVELKDFSIEELLELDNELLKLLKTNERKTADLRLIGMSSMSGTIGMNKKLSRGMKFISESVTGYYHKILFEVPR